MADIKLQRFKRPKRKRINISTKTATDDTILLGLRACRQNEERRNRDSLEKAKSISIYQSLLDSEETQDNIEKVLKANIVSIIPQKENVDDILSLCMSSLEYSSEDEIHYTKIYRAKDGEVHSIKPLNIIFHLPEFFHIFADAAMSAVISLAEQKYYKLIWVALKSIIKIVPNFDVKLTESAATLAYNLFKNFGTSEIGITKIKDILKNTDYDIKYFDQDIAMLEKYKCIEKISSNKYDEQCIKLREKINLGSFER